MSEVKINNAEKDDCAEMIIFLKNLSPDLKEKFKTIILWENLKGSRKSRQCLKSV